METTTQRQPESTPSRRGLLAAGTTGLAATAFLAACSSSDGPKAGLSGAPVPTTEAPPTVPVKPPTEAQLQEDLDMLATANSIELLAAEVYRRHGRRRRARRCWRAQPVPAHQPGRSLALAAHRR